MSDETTIAEELGAATKPGQILDYDFSKPNRIPKEQRKTLGLIHETFAESLAVTLGATLRCEAEVELEQVEQESFQEYVSALMTPTCVASFDMHPLTGIGVIEVNSILVYSVIDRMLGGDGEVSEIVRAFTDIELSLARKFLNIILNQLAESWSHLVQLSFNLKKAESNPALIRQIPMREVCLTVYLKVGLGNTRGMLTLCIPYASLEPIASKMRNDQWTMPTSLKHLEAVKEAHRENFNQVEVDLTAILGRIDLNLAELLLVQPGDILSTDQKVRAPIDIRVDGLTKFRGFPGLHGKQRAVSIQELLTKEKKHG